MPGGIYALQTLIKFVIEMQIYCNKMCCIILQLMVEYKHTSGDKLGV